jgi:hypothetical protein
MNKNHLLQKVFDFYGKHSVVPAGLSIPSCVEHAFVDGSLMSALPKSGQIIDDLKRIGILSGMKERFLGYVIFPILDQDGNMESLVGLHLKTHKELWLDGDAVWNLPSIRNADKAIPVKTLASAFALIDKGRTNVVVTHGNAKIRFPFSTDIGGEPIKPEPHEQTSTGFIFRSGLIEYELIDIEKCSRTLKATVRLSKNGRTHIDTVNFYSFRERQRFSMDVCRIVDEVPDQIQNDMQQLVKISEQYSDGNPERNPIDDRQRIMSEEEEQEAISFGQSPNLFEQILADYERCGLIGEDRNKLLSYLAMTSRKMTEPLNIIIQSSSGAGKSFLQDTTLLFCPQADVMKVTQLSEKALFYLDRNLKHKVLAIEEGSGIEGGSAYALRALISSATGISTVATIRDARTGKLTAMSNCVEGPVAVFFTTSSPEVDEELRSRMLVLALDESHEQSRRIIDHCLGNCMVDADELDKVLKKHRNFQSLLKPYRIINPYLGRLKVSEYRLNVRRSLKSYLNIIGSVCFLRQMVKEVKTKTTGGKNLEHIEVDKTDIEAGHQLASSLISRSIDLSEPARSLFQEIGSMLKERTGGKNGEPSFSRRELMEFTGWKLTRLRTYLLELADYEIVVTAGRNGRLKNYQVAYHGELNGNDRLFEWVF